MTYIYKTTNLINNKIYIGQRVYRKKDDNLYFGSGINLNKSIKKYGRENFVKEIIEICTCKQELNEKEKYWIKFYDSTNRNIGYNISEGGDGGNLGELVNKKISSKLKGIKKPKSFGEKISKALKGKPKSKAHVEKVKQSLIGKKHTKERNDKMSKSIKQKYINGWESPKNIEVYQYDKNNGNYINSFKSATHAGKTLNINRKSITNNCVGKSKSSGGFVWSKYKTNNIFK